MILLLYTTIDQMRPAEIVEAIHDHILIARERQLPLLRRTRRFSQSGDANSETILATKHGFVARVDAEALGAAASLGGAVSKLFCAFRSAPRWLFKTRLHR